MFPTSSPASPTSLGEEFVNIIPEISQNWPHCHPRDPKESTDFYSRWLDKVSGPLSLPVVFGADALKRLYPNHSLVITDDYMLNILAFPGSQATPLEKSPLITDQFFVPVARRIGIPGVLVDSVVFGIFNVNWKQYEFLVHVVAYPSGIGYKSLHFVLYDGPEDVSRLFLSSVGAWTHELHEEIWAFEGGFWKKSHSLWREVQKADWKDVILKDEFKKALQKDVYGFFNSEDIYNDLSIPWKRGLIMYGPPGNGKTISLKVIMKTCSDKGFLPLYVRSFQRIGWLGEETAMKDVFDKARQLSPCVVILEDLDSLINDRNRSFFLNQLDGLEGNDGLLIIATTNHFEKLDPGLNTRPSRFDRKYLFDDPNENERQLYAQYWQNKLSSNKDIHFPDSLVDEFAASTAGFSFAYLKEAFVSSLVILAGSDGDKPTFESMLKGQIAELRKQTEKSTQNSQLLLETESPTNSMLRGPKNQADTSLGGFKDVLSLLRTLPVRPAQRIFSTAAPTNPREDSQSNERNFRDLIDRLASREGDINPQVTENTKFYFSPPHHPVNNG